MDQRKLRLVLLFPLGLCFGAKGGWKLWLLLFLPRSFCIDTEDTIAQTVVGETFVSPLCSNATKQNDAKDIIVLITCSIRTQSSREDCRLLYYHGKGFEHGCGSRFRLIAENHTILLHLTSLRAEDSGNYSCECSHLTGTTTILFNITVEENEDISDSAEMSLLTVWIVLTGVIITGVTLGLIHWSASQSDCWTSATSGTSVYKVCSSLAQDDPDDQSTNSTVTFSLMSPLIRD